MKKILFPIIVLFALTVLTSGCGDFFARMKAGFSGPQEIQKPGTHLVVVKECNIRSERNSHCKILAIAGKGITFEKIGQSGNWFHVKLASGDTGWVFKDVVKEVKKGNK